MRAMTYHGAHDVRVETVPDPIIEAPDDIILRVTATAICGSDLHLYDGVVPGMVKGDIVGHEFMGEVVEVGSGVQKLNRGDRVLMSRFGQFSQLWASMAQRLGRQTAVSDSSEQ